jgi:hypothetical protein
MGRVKEPKVYKGDSTRELNEFMASLRAIFRYQPGAFPTEQSKVAFAAQYLEGDPMKEWDNRCAAQDEGYRDTLDIAGFEEFLRDLHVDPANRQRIAALKYNGALQRKGQSIRKFVAYLEDLEREMEPYLTSIRRRKARNTRTASEVASEVVSEEEEATLEAVKLHNPLAKKGHNNPRAGRRHSRAETQGQARARAPVTTAVRQATSPRSVEANAT